MLELRKRTGLLVRTFELKRINMPKSMFLEHSQSALSEWKNAMSRVTYRWFRSTLKLIVPAGGMISSKMMTLAPGFKDGTKALRMRCTYESGQLCKTQRNIYLE